MTKLAKQLLVSLKEQEEGDIAGEVTPVETPAPVNVAAVVADKLVSLGLEDAAIAIDVVDTDSKISITSGGVQGTISFGIDDDGKEFISVEKVGGEAPVKIDLSGIENIPKNDKGGVDLSNVSWISDDTWMAVIAALGLTKVEKPEETPAPEQEPAPEMTPEISSPEPVASEPVSTESVQKRFEAFKKKSK